MSGENKQNEQFEVAFEFAGKETEVLIEFADGIKEIPDHVIAGLGGSENLKKIAPGLKQKNYAEFLAGYRKVIEKRELNRFQQNFVAGHFGKMF